MSLLIIRNDITLVNTDAIVNTANPLPVIGDGTDAAVHKAAGPRLLEERQKLGMIPRGESRVTPGFDLPAKYVIHTVGGHWDGNEQALRRCYDSALEAASATGCRSVAFPLLAAGCYGCPVEISLRIAKEAFRAFLETHDMDILLVLFSPDAVHSCLRESRSIQAFIDDNYVGTALARERSPFNRLKERFKRKDLRSHSAEDRVPGSRADDWRKEDAPWIPTAEPETLEAFYAPEKSGSVAEQAQYSSAQEPPRQKETAPGSAAAQIPDFSCCESSPVVEAEGLPFFDAEGGIVSADAVKKAADSPASEPRPAAGKPKTPAPAIEPLSPCSMASKPKKAAGSDGAPAARPAVGALLKTGKKLPAASLEEALRVKDESFPEMLFRKIKADGRKTAAIYKAANLSKAAFSKINTAYLDHKPYIPKRETVFALAIALKLNLEETRELMLKAGYGMSRSILTDVIVEYFIVNRNYDIDDINIALFDNDCVLLGSV